MRSENRGIGTEKRAARAVNVLPKWRIGNTNRNFEIGNGIAFIKGERKGIRAAGQAIANYGTVARDSASIGRQLGRGAAIEVGKRIAKWQPT